MPRSRPSIIARWWRRNFAEPPDPDTVPHGQPQADAVMARAEIGLQPWPNRPEADYLNSVIHTCSQCGRPIYGGGPVCFDGWTTLCGVCFPSNQPD